MKYNVNGIAFSKDELSTITLKEIKVNSISHSHLFFIPRNEKNAFMILRAGDYIEQTFIDKYTEKGVYSFYSLPVASFTEIKIYRSLFIELKNAMNEKERKIKAQNIVKKFALDFWIESDKSYLNFAVTCFEHFNFLNPEIIDKYQTTSLTLYSRSMISASLGIIVCFAHKMVDPLFVKDLYNSIFIMDYGLIEDEKFSFTLAQACEAERTLAGSGIELLEKMNRSPEEIDLFRQHPIKSSLFTESIKALFEYPEVLDVIKYHHEKSNGSGFPAGISYSALGDFETFQMFCDYMVSFSEVVYERGDGKKIVKDMFEQLEKNSKLQNLPINKVLMTWLSIMKWAVVEDSVVEDLTEQEEVA